MVSNVLFQMKKNNKHRSDQKISFSIKKVITITIVMKGTLCEILVDGETEANNLEHIILIWELLVWTDGYFYKPIHYFVDNIEKSLDSLLSITCRVTDQKWIFSSVLLCRNQRQINEETLEKYRNIRYLSRKEKSMNASLFSSFFYLISESYSKINLEHRLVLLMHICDGFAIHFCNGKSHNNSGNISIILRKINTKYYKHGSELLGITPSKAIEALGQTRNELTHYTYKAESLGSFIDDPDTQTDSMVNLYAFYILELALRIAVLEAIGMNIPDDIKNYAMNEHLDWIKLTKHLDESCVLPRNILRQALEKFNQTQTS